jgi:hypothetical protein
MSDPPATTSKRVKKMCEFDANLLSRLESHFPPGMFWWILNTLIEGLVDAIEEDQSKGMRGLIHTITKTRTYPSIQESITPEAHIHGDANSPKGSEI